MSKYRDLKLRLSQEVVTDAERRFAEAALKHTRAVAMFDKKTFLDCYWDMTAKEIVVASATHGIKPLDELPLLTEQQRCEVVVLLV
jgi:hypothetical protein